MHVTIEPETIVSKVTDTVVPNRRQLCRNGGIGYQQKDLTATGHEHTTLVFTLNLYVKVINAQKKKFSTKDFLSKSDQSGRKLKY